MPNRAEHSRIHRRRLLTELGLVLAVLGGAASARATMTTGAYTGDGADNRTIAGLGFRPTVVIVKGDLAESAIIRTATMPDGWSKQLAQERVAITDRIVRFTDDGFVLGADADVNQAGTSYWWVAFDDVPGEFATGDYWGNGLASQTIGGVGFAPGFVLVMPAESSRCRFRTASMPAGTSLPFDDVPLEPNGIVALGADGFTVGGGSYANGYGERYHYLAAAATPGRAAFGSYAGDGTDNRIVQTAGLRPRWVLTKSGGAEPGAHLPAELSGDDATLNFWPAGNFPHGFQQFTGLGFGVGNSEQVNGLGRTYYFAAFASGATAADVAVALELDQATREVGETVTVTGVLRNEGPELAPNAELQIEVPAGLALESLTVDPGVLADFSTPDRIHLVWDLPDAEQRTVVAVYRIERGAAQRTFTGHATAAAPDANLANNTDVANLAVLSADLAVTVAASNLAPAAGDTVQLTVGVDNLGPESAPAPAVTVTLPDGVTLVAAAPGSGGFDPDLSVWTPDGLDAGEHADLLLDAAIAADQAGQTLIASAVVTSPRNDPAAANDTTSVALAVAATSDLAVAAAFAPTSADPGQTVTLTVTLANVGPADAADFAATVSAPAELVYLSHDVDAGTFDADTGSWTSASPLLDGATAVLAITYQAGAGGGGPVAATVTVAGGGSDPDPANNTATAVLDLTGAGAVAIAVVPFADPDRALLPGGSLDDVLRLRLVNTGGVPRVLTALAVHNPPTDGATQSVQDGYWHSLELVDGNGGALGAGTFAAGSLTFGDLGLALAAGETLAVALRGAAALWAPDGVELRPEVSGAADLQFGGLVDLAGDWPLVAPGTLVVDGMTAGQIALHPIGAEVFQMGSVRNLALDVTLPANGGAPDELNRLNVVNEGTAAHATVLTRLEAWADDGDGVFAAAADARLADLNWPGGSRFEATALAWPIAASGLRVFVTVDIAEDALGGTVRLSLPAGDDVGVGVASGNDGPIDAPVTNPLAQTVSSTDKVIVTTAPLSSRAVAPGEDHLPLLHLVARNLYAETRTVRQLRVRNVTAGQAGASQAALDAGVGQLVIQRDGDQDGELDDDAIDPVVVSTTWVDGLAVFDGVRWSLPPGEVSHLFVTARVATHGPADGDRLGAVIGGAADLEFTAATAVVGAWPLDSGARYPVDGLVAAQVACPAVPPVSLTASEGPVLALDLGIPGNGYLDDTLESLRLRNVGTAQPADVAALALYADDNANGIFEPALDTALGSLGAVGQDWIALDLDLAGPAAGRRLFAALTVAAVPTDSATVRLALPVGGLVMTSANDGPRDAAVVSPTSLLMSTAPLLSDLAFATDRSTTEMTVTVTMRVHNVGGEDVIDITPRDVLATGDGLVTLVSGPEPASLDLAQGSTGEFQWVFASEHAGPVYVTARCEGTGAVGGQPRGSLASASAAHVVYEPAIDLELFPVANMPFSINRGQTGVVPLTLTLLNEGGAGRADLRLARLVITLDDGDQQPVVPADLLARVAVNEGIRVYCDRTDPETSGSTLTLDLSPQVVVTSREPVTLGLRLDIRGDTAVERFRVGLLAPADLTVVDDISGASRTVQLVDADFPVHSAAGSIVTQATGLVVADGQLDDRTAGAGQADVELLRLWLSSEGDDSASEVKVGGFAVAVVDTAGQPVADASLHLSRLWVAGPLTIHAVRDLAGPADSLVTFELLPQITVPAGAPPVVMSVHAQLPDDPVLGPLRLRLREPATFDARDANVSASVPVVYQPAQIRGPRLTIEAPAPALLVAAAGQLPPVISLGARDVAALTLMVRHPGPESTASVSLDTLRLACLDEARRPQDPDAILDGYRVRWNNEDLSVPVVYADRHLVIPLGGRRLAPLAEGTLTLRIDIEADAPAGAFELVAADTCLGAHDGNLSAPGAVWPAPGSVLPASSGLARLQPASGEVTAGWQDRLPPLLPTAPTLVEALRLRLANPAPVGSAPVELAALVVRAVDRDGAVLAAGAALGSIRVEVDGTPWADIAATIAGDTTLVLAGLVPLELAAGAAREVVVWVGGRPGGAPDGVRLGLDEADIVCVQPGSTTRVTVRPAPGLVFPIWTALTGLGAATLDDSYLNFPNPFAAGREATSFAFTLPAAARVSLQIWTPRGESVVQLLADRELAAGLHQDVRWDGRNGRGQTVRNGVYLAELTVTYASGEGARLMRKVAVVR